MPERNRINSPAQPERDSKAQIHECKFALEPSLARLAERAIEAGWKRHQIAIALALYADEIFAETKPNTLQ